MPTLDKMFTLTVSVEQFLSACSETELQELELLLPSYLDRIRRNHQEEIQKENETLVCVQCGSSNIKNFRGTFFNTHIAKCLDCEITWETT